MADFEKLLYIIVKTDMILQLKYFSKKKKMLNKKNKKMPQEFCFFIYCISALTMR